MIELKEIGKQYHRGGFDITALRHVGLYIASGEFVAIMGPSGSGKSTLMNILGLLDRPDSGSYLFEGNDIAQLTAAHRAVIRNRRVGFVFQNFNLLPRSRAIENVELPLVYAGVHRAERRRRAVQALEQVGLGQRIQHWPQQLSGGEQQRVAIARAMVADPVILLADEPTGALDTRTGLEVLALFQGLHRNGRTVVIVTHEPSVARHAGRIISLRDGGVVDDRAEPTPLDANRSLREIDESETASRVIAR